MTKTTKTKVRPIQKSQDQPVTHNPHQPFFPPSKNPLNQIKSRLPAGPPQFKPGNRSGLQQRGRG